jgi:aminodeoxyfutalosine synthase
MAPSIDTLTSKIEAGAPLTDADTEALGASRDIIRLGMLATTVRAKLHGTEVTFARVADLELTGGPAVQRSVGESPAVEAGEYRVFKTPQTLEVALEVVARAKDLAAGVPLSAFCLFELSKLPEGLPVVLRALKGAGLDLITQAPIDKLAEPERALEALTDAGLTLTRLTVNDTPQRPWVQVCRDISALQRTLQSIRTFAPLARHIDTSQPTTGYDDVRRVALARIVVENVQTIQVDWMLYGPKLAQVALTFGADDIDSVSAGDDQSQGRRRSPIEDIRRSIHAAGYEPVERDARFQRRG